MIISALARRYARALADVAMELGVHEAVTRDLEDLVSAFRTSADLAGALKNPAVPQEKKMALLEAVWSLSGARLNPQTHNFIVLLIKNSRMGLLEQIQSAYQAAIDSRLGIVAADVTTRFKIREEQKPLLAERLAAVTGNRVKMTFATDESLIGGVIVRIGSTIYDGSVRRQLDEIRMRLAGE